MIETQQICWIGQRASDAFGLHRRLNVQAIICCDYGQAGRTASDRLCIPIFSLEKESHYRKNWSSLLLNDAVKAAASSKAFHKCVSGNSALLPYATTPAAEQLAAYLGLQLIGPSCALRGEFDDKFRARALFERLHLPLIPGRKIDRRTCSYGTAAALFGVPFVLRRLLESSGQGTYLVHRQAEFDHVLSKLQDGETEILIEQYEVGYSPNVNAIASSLGTIVAPISIQVIGAKECGGSTFTYCGNDFSAAANLPQEVSRKCRDFTSAIGVAMSERGYRGIFGVDFIVNAKRDVFPIEINARFQNSTAILNGLQSEGDGPILAELHIAAYFDSKPMLSRALNTEHKVVDASQLILHNRETISKAKVAGFLREGAYRQKATLGYTSDALDISECRSNEMLIGSGVPEPGLELARGAPLLRLQFRRGVLDNRLDGLLPFAAELANEVYERLMTSQ